MMKNYMGISLLLILFASCASLHTPSPHFVPSIVRKHQFEGEAAVGYKTVSASLAFSPFKNVTIMGNVQRMPFNAAPSQFQRNSEVALGTYGSLKHIIFGVNAGYGLGAYNWNYHQFNDSVSYSLLTKGNFQKLMLQAFLAFTDDSSHPSWLAGISLKQSFYWDQYASLKYTTRELADFRGAEKNMAFEPCVFVKVFFNEKIYLNGQSGMNISYDRSMFWPGQYIFVRIGVGLKI